MHHPTDRITHTTTFVTPVVEHWLEREIVQWVQPLANALTTELHLAPVNNNNNEHAIIILYIFPVFLSDGLAVFLSYDRLQIHITKIQRGKALPYFL